MSESSTRTGAIASEIRRLVGIPETTIYTGDMDTCFMEAVKRIEALERERDGFREILNENEEEIRFVEDTGSYPLPDLGGINLAGFED